MLGAMLGTMLAADGVISASAHISFVRDYILIIE